MILIRSLLPEASSDAGESKVEQPQGNADYNESIAGKEGWKVKGETLVPVQANTDSSQYPVDESKKILTGILGIVIPGLGIHNFIYSYTIKGIIQAVLYIVWYFNHLPRCRNIFNCRISYLVYH